jgi:hypothetical protein
VLTEREPPDGDLGRIAFVATPETFSWQDRTIRAEIIGSNQCRAEGLAVSGPAPVLAMCRKLIGAGFDPARSLAAFRGNIVCLAIRSIGKAARLTVKERPYGPTFVTWEPFPTGPVSPPMRQKGWPVHRMPRATEKHPGTSATAALAPAPNLAAEGRKP